MTRKRRRLYAVSAGMFLLAAAAALVLNAFRDSLVFFYGPSEALAKSLGPDQRFRLGGLVERGSLGKDGVTVTFNVTDGAAAVPVRFAGILPDLFREGQGVVAEGRMLNGTFEARNVLAKHDETYMPPEVVEALKKSGQWQSEKKP
ncbi:MAG: cytochrome c maturation protein CcmE [Alphaproteobacteria bacterium]|nr:cytochrome c maturation protein CcmE [Alphaproteobacteria bacterium]